MLGQLRPMHGAWLALLLFTALHTFLSMDRAVLSILLEPIKREFRVSDSALGVLTGLVFFLIYGVAGIPLGVWIDRSPRKPILVGCVSIFSLMTALSGAARSFLQLAGARMFVGVGEAGASPAMLSMISDMFPAARRATVISLYYLGNPLGFVLTFLVGGRAAAAHGWRSVFWLAGGPGLVLAIIVAFLTHEPLRLHRASSAGDRSLKMPIIRLLARRILSAPSLLMLLLTASVTSVISAGEVAWVASLLIRTRHMNLPQAGALIAYGYGAASTIGVLGGGWVVDRIGLRKPRRGMWFLAGCMIVSLVSLNLFLITKGGFSACALVVWAIASSVVYGPTLAFAHNLVGPRLRGSVSATYYAFTTIGGAAFGPLIVGVLSDAWKPSLGADAIQAALQAISALYFFAAALLIGSGVTLIRDLRCVNEPEFAHIEPRLAAH